MRVIRNLQNDTIYHFPSVLNPFLLFYYPKSTSTTLAAYYRRHFPVLLDEYDGHSIANLYRYLRKFVIHPAKLTREQYVATIYPASKRRNYQDACDHLDSGGRMFTSVRPFTKLEKMSRVKYKAPRLIQARDITFNIEYGSYIKPLETNITHGPFKIHFGKGDYNEIASRIVVLANKYKYYTEIDHSNFDSHVTIEMLKLTHKFYSSCYHHNKHLAMLSKHTLTNKCRTRTGESYTIKGTRMSGDVDTSFGNCLINYALIRGALDKLNIKGDAIVNGDDSIIFTNSPINLQRITTIFRTYNMEVKAQPSTTNLQQVEFCRTRLIYNDNAIPTMMINPTRLLSIYGMTYRPLSNYQEYLIEVLLANSIINQSNILGFLFLTMYKNAIAFATKKFPQNRPSRLRYKFKHLDDNLKRLLDRERHTNYNHATTPNNDTYQAWGDELLDFDRTSVSILQKLLFIFALPRLHTEQLKDPGLKYGILGINHDMGIVE